MTTRADVLVVGSGPLGATVARRLAEHGRTVLILEQGPAISDPPGSHVRNAVRFRADPDAYLKVAGAQLEHFDNAASRDHLPGASVTRAQGGQGVIWTNLCPRSDAPWDALTPAQWEEYYGLAETYLGVQAEQFESSVRQQRIRARIARHLAARGRRIFALPVAARFDAGDQMYFSSPYDILAGSGEAGARVHSARATVDNLVVHGSRVTGVDVGNETITANAIVVAAGAIGTPCLLHRSGTRRWDGGSPIIPS